MLGYHAPRCELDAALAIPNEPIELVGLRLARDAADLCHQLYLTLKAEVHARDRLKYEDRAIGAKQVLDDISAEIARIEGAK